MPTTSKHLVCGPTWGPARDAFRHGGLSGSARRVYWQALAHGKRTADECADELSLARSTVRKALCRLEDHGLAVQVDGRWHRVEKSDEEWTRIAAAVGKLGASERQEHRAL